MNTHVSTHRQADDAERRKWQNPEAILADIGLKQGMTFMDIGCGGGFFALPAARIVGKSGRIYGIDTDAHSLSALNDLANKEGLRNLELKRGRAEHIVLCESCADIVFFGIVLHDFEDPVRVLQNAKKMLRVTGKLVNLDWKKVSMKLGPPIHKRFSEEEAIQVIEAAGFSVVTVKDAGLYHYLILAKP